MALKKKAYSFQWGWCVFFFIWAGDGYWGVEQRAAHAGLVMCEEKYLDTA
jgi:hypothetical protein